MLWAQDSIPEEFKQFPAHRIRVQCGKDSYQTRKTFQKMMLGYYLPEMIHIRKQMDKTATPILLILDGHSSRICLPFIRFCKANNIIVLILPAHTSSITQPLDCVPNGVFKSKFAAEAATRVNGGIPVAIPDDPQKEESSGPITETNSAKATVEAEGSKATVEAEGSKATVEAEGSKATVEAEGSKATLKWKNRLHQMMMNRNTYLLFRTALIQEVLHRDTHIPPQHIADYWRKCCQ